MWQAYWDEPTVENKNSLVLHYIYLVRSVTLRMMPAYSGHVDFDDLLSNGIIGLMDAIDRFDGEKGVKFESYALKRIRGEIYDYMRKQDWISSSMRMRINKVRNACDALNVELGRKATEEEIAVRAGCTPEQVRKAQEDEYTYNIVYFERMAMGGDGTYSLIDSIVDPNEENDPEKCIERQSMRAILAKALCTLTENEKKVVALYYREELLLREVAEVLGVTESRACQIHAKALKKLRQAIQEQMTEGPHAEAEEEKQ